MAARLQVAVIGGGWAGMAAAVEATRLGHQVTVFEMARQLGGRARQVDNQGVVLDNGQHILIGAYAATLAMMKSVGVDLNRALKRTPLRIVYPDGAGLQLAAGAPIPALLQAIRRYPGWTRADKWALVATSGKWALRGFRCAPELTVSALIAHLPAKVRAELLEPLCVAALNTPAPQASAQVFLRVLKDALFGGKGAADLLLPRWRLSALLPDPAAKWLASAGARIELARRVDTLVAQESRWLVDGAAFDRVILAASALEAARLVSPIDAAWSTEAQGLQYEPIVTVYAHSQDVRLPHPMMALHSDANRPAQFVFDLGALSGMEGVLAFVISGAAHWVGLGADATIAATLRQGLQALKPHLHHPLTGMRAISEKRATFLCTPGLTRPRMQVAPGLVAAGDYVDGPYPATLEGAVRAGVAAASALT